MSADSQPLTSLQVGQAGTVTEIKVPPENKARILEMGLLVGTPREWPVTVLDLPGTYSLSPQSLDEQISRDVLLHRLKDVPPPDLVVIVVDGSNLQRHLYYATQVIELGYPTLIALNMIDVAE